MKVVRFIVGSEEPRRVTIVTNLPDEVLKNVLDMVKDIHAEDIQELLDEFIARNAT